MSRALAQAEPFYPAAAAVLGLPRHNFPQLAQANNVFWGAVIERAGLTRPAAYAASIPWSDLTLAQVCAYGFVTQWASAARLVATPSYRARGGDGPFLRSAVLVREADPAQGLSDLRGRTCAYDRDDGASRNLLRAETAVLARDGGFFGRLAGDAGPLSAVNRVVQGEADAVLIDGAALAHVQRLHSGLVSKLRLILWTARGPGPPLVTSALASSADVLNLRAALADAIADPALAAERGELLIRDIHPLPESQYRALLHFEQMAQSQGYPELK
jgi:ABC-type phosphate/phosphonate transport system substrate-binding protein